MDAQSEPNAPRPQVAVLAGINGAGKSSSSERLLRESLKIPSFTNADTIARGLNAFDVESEAVKAGRIMLEHLRELAKARRSFAFETTLSGRAYARWLRELASEGYAVHLFYYWLRSPDLAIRRVAERVRAGGHHVPDDTVRRRYSRSVRNFLELYRPVVTTWQVYDNSNGARRLIAFNNSFFDTVLDPDTWEAFNRSADDGGANDTSND
jgi:predicted ABC-type ATPase